MTLFYHPFIRWMLALWMLFVCLSLVWTLMRLLQQKRYPALAAVLLFFAGSDIYRQYLNASSFFVPELNNTPYYAIDLSPIWLIILINVLLSICAVAVNLRVWGWQRRHITAVSIKESFDTMESGVCFYEAGGRIYLVNEAMDALMPALAGQHLNNGERLWEILQQKSSIAEADKAMVAVGDRVYSFTRYEDTVRGQQLFEIIAADITEQARHNAQLEEKHCELEHLSALLDDYNQNLQSIVRERELIKSKAKIHDEMNVLIMSTMRCIEDFDEADAQRLVERWKSNILAFEKDTEPYRKNPLETLEDLAHWLGIVLEFSGTFPAETDNARLLITAVSECMTNALRHAGAKTLFVRADEGGAVITNDGAAPQEPIAEGGGLSNLRRRAGKAGAAMEIKSTPEFSLTIHYRKEVL